MAKNKTTTGETESGRIPKKAATTLKAPPNEERSPQPSPFAASHALVSNSSSAGRTAAIVSPAPPARSIWDHVVNQRGATATDPPPAEANPDAEEEDDDEALSSLCDIGLKPKAPEEPVAYNDVKPAAIMRRSSRDAFIKGVVVELMRGLCLLAVRFASVGATKNFVDYKMFRLHELYKLFIQAGRPDATVTMPHVDNTTLRILRRMARTHVDPNYYLWHANNQPQLSNGTIYATRLYGMVWPEMINRDQAVGLCQFLCEYLNMFRVPRPEAANTTATTTYEPPRQESMAYLQNPADPSTLFWIEFGTDIVCTDIMSESNAFDLFRRHLAQPLTINTYSEHKEDIAKYFRPGTMNYATAAAIGAPFDMMSDEGQSEWRRRSNLPAPE